MIARRALPISAALACLLAVTACGASKPEALPDDAAFRACLKDAGVKPDQLDSRSDREAAFKQAAPWDCVLSLRSADDRHAVLGGLFASDESALVAPITAWIGTQQDDGEAIADDVGTLLAATDEPMPDDSDEASQQSQADGILNDRLALIVYLHADGKPPAYDAYMGRADMKGQPDAQNRYFQHQLDLGGPEADRLGAYSDDIAQKRADLRAK